MQIKSVKNVNKSVNKSANNWWMKNVQKSQNLSFPQFFKFSTKVLQNIIDKFCTKNLLNLPLLNTGFTPFPHSTTITTTIFINNKETNF